MNASTMQIREENHRNETLRQANFRMAVANALPEVAIAATGEAFQINYVSMDAWRRPGADTEATLTLQAANRTEAVAYMNALAPESLVLIPSAEEYIQPAALTASDRALGSRDILPVYYEFTKHAGLRPATQFVWFSTFAETVTGHRIRCRVRTLISDDLAELSIDGKCYRFPDGRAVLMKSAPDMSRVLVYFTPDQAPRFLEVLLNETGCISLLGYDG